MEERNIISELGRDSSIEIKSSNKGCLVVVQDVSAYKAEAIWLLPDENTYIKLKGNHAAKFKKTLQELAQKGVCLVLYMKEGEAMLPNFPIH